MVSIALLTVSDTRDIKNDDSGQFLVDSVKIDKHNISNRIICKDNVYIIRKYISDWIADDEIDVIITTGGTGLTFTDVTPEAIKPLLDKEIEGFAEIFRYTSFKKIGTNTLQSRCIAGVANGTFIFSLPGSYRPLFFISIISLISLRGVSVPAISGDSIIQFFDKKLF